MEGLPPLEQFLARLDALDKKMSEPDFYNDQRSASALSREHQQLAKLKESYLEFEKVLSQIDENKKISIDKKNKYAAARMYLYIFMRIILRNICI